MSSETQSPRHKKRIGETTGDSTNSKQKKRQPRPPKKITERYLTNSGLYYLQRFPASTAQFRKVMMRKIAKSLKHHKTPTEDQAAEMLDNITEKFVEYGYLNDKAYAHGLVQSLRNRGTSQAKISAKLREKGIYGELLQQAMEVENPKEEDLKAALTYLRKKRRGIFALKDRENGYDKDLAALARQGFNFDTAKTALDMDLEDISQIMED